MTDHISIDGVFVEIKIIEGWGFNLGEDVCLSEQDGNSVRSCPDIAELHDDIETNKNVDVLVDKIVKDLQDAEDEDQNFYDNNNCEENLETTVPAEKHVPLVHRSGDSDSPKQVTQANSSGSFNVQPSPNADSISSSLKDASAHVPPEGMAMFPEVSASADVMLSRKHGVQPISCSHATAQFSRKGPWNVEWLHNIQQGDVGLISSKKKSRFTS